MEGREQLKKKFKVANIGYESYRALIESTLNKKDDGIEKNTEDGLKLWVEGGSSKLLSFFGDKTSHKAEWYIRLNPENLKGLDISKDGMLGRTFFIKVDDEGIDDEREKEVKVGIGTSHPQTTLDVNGTISMEARVGSFKMGKIPADRKWHTILDEADGLSDCQAYEIFSHINDDDTRRYSLTYAVVLISKGSGGVTIKATSRYFWGKFLNKIKFRRAKEYGREVIQIKSRDHWFARAESTKNIYFRVTKLWDKDFENEIYIEKRRVKEASDLPKRIKIRK
ncbi:MAG: hypothetical protein H6581_16160 [Bacteroidia bacterium]|nr:hypothetical protein [Bacteroidia bacterium]